MLMVIFGAGASYDSAPDFPPPQPQGGGHQSFGLPPAPPNPREFWRPPLANQLFLDQHDTFGNIVVRYDRLRPILNFLRLPQNGRSVEQQLELYRDEANEDLERKSQLFSVRYYLHDLFREISSQWLKQTNHLTNYVILLDQIRHLNTAAEPVCLVTFNYDVLLDDALLSFGYAKPQDVKLQPNAHPMFKLLKPHGSTDWARLLDSSPSLSRLQPQQLIERAREIELSDNYVTADASNPHEMFNFDQPIVPAIAIPVQTKTQSTFEWPAIHRNFFLTLLPSVTKILIIGWQGKEAHFMNLLREKLPTGGLTQITHLQVVGRDPEEAQNIRKEFTQQIGRNVKKPYNGPTEGFSHFVRRELVHFFFED